MKKVALRLTVLEAQMLLACEPWDLDYVDPDFPWERGERAATHRAFKKLRAALDGAQPEEQAQLF